MKFKHSTEINFLSKRNIKWLMLVVVIFIRLLSPEFIKTKFSCSLAVSLRETQNFLFLQIFFPAKVCIPEVLPSLTQFEIFTH